MVKIKQDPQGNLTVTASHNSRSPGDVEFKNYTNFSVKVQGTAVIFKDQSATSTFQVDPGPAPVDIGIVDGLPRGAHYRYQVTPLDDKLSPADGVDEEAADDEPALEDYVNPLSSLQLLSVARAADPEIIIV